MDENLKRFSNYYKGRRIVVDERLEGEKVAEMNNENDEEVRMSPAMFKLWETDREELYKNAKIRFLKIPSNS